MLPTPVEVRLHSGRNNRTSGSARRWNEEICSGSPSRSKETVKVEGTEARDTCQFFKSYGVSQCFWMQSTTRFILAAYSFRIDSDAPATMQSR